MLRKGYRKRESIKWSFLRHPLLAPDKHQLGDFLSRRLHEFVWFFFFLFFNSFMLLASLTSCGNKFHNVIMCCVKMYFLLSTLDLAPEFLSPRSFILILWGRNNARSIPDLSDLFKPLCLHLSQDFVLPNWRLFIFLAFPHMVSTPLLPLSLTTLFHVSSHFIIAFFWDKITEVRLAHSWRH